MATYTTFLNLEKPSTSERLDVLKINSNWDKIDAGVSALNSQMTTVVNNALTAGTNVTIDMQRALFVGKQATYNLVITTSTSKSRNDTIASGLKNHDGGFNGVPTIVATDNSGNFAYFMASDTNLICAATVPAGKWRMAFSYIST